MKIGVMTWFHYHNYGTALQGCALFRKLQDMGEEPYMIRYIPRGHTKTLTNAPDIRRKILEKAAARLYPVYKNEARENLFRAFQEEHLRFTKSCDFLHELESLNDSLDCFICGSDQIWAPSCFDPRYFLDFAADSEKMIAYAPSVGVKDIAPGETAERMKTLCGRFAHLSVRESVGAGLISRLCGKPAETVLDPVLLFAAREWRAFESRAISVRSPYLLVYLLGRNPRRWRQVREIARKLNLPVRVIPVFQKDTEREGCLCEPVGPGEFLALIRNAAFVCTDSFHATAFSILYGVDFCTFARFRETDPVNQNSRAEHLLSLLSLENRLVYGEFKKAPVEPVRTFSTARERLSELREASLRYLSGSLAAVKAHNAAAVGVRKKRRVLQNRSLCCGCGACAAACPVGAIRIETDSAGFYRAVAEDALCVSCGACERACPFVASPPRFPLEGGKLYSYKDFSGEVLLRSSSGGAAYRLAQAFLENGGAAVGCVFDGDAHGAKHILIENEAQLRETQNSKYMQSEFSEALRRCVSYPRPLMVIGTPCQIVGARGLLKGRNDVFYADLICHGVPSRGLYEKYLAYLVERYHMESSGLRIVFRDKTRGWREIYIYIEDLRGRWLRQSQREDLFFRMFEAGDCYAASCYECPWRSGSAADIRLGDYWHTKYKRDKTGVSMLMSFTERGEALTRKLDAFGALKPEPVEEYFLCQQTLNYRRPTYWEDLITALNDETSSLETIASRYLFPEERVRKLSAWKNRIKSAVKRNE